MKRAGFLEPIVMALAIFLRAGASAAQEQAEQTEEAGYEYQDEEVIRLALDETLSQPEFARLRAEPEPKKETKTTEMPGWLDRFIRSLARALWGEQASEEEPSELGFSLPGARLILLAMALLILLAAVFFIVRTALAISRDKKRLKEEEAEARVFGPEAAPGELDPDEFWRRALSLGEKRRYKEALRELLLGAMSALERKGSIRFRRGLTNRDYLYSVRGPARESFALIASAFEYVYFGRREPTAEAFRDTCRAYQKSFRGASS